MKKYHLKVVSLVESKLISTDFLSVKEYMNESSRLFFFTYSGFEIENGSLFNYLFIDGQVHPINAKLVFITQQFNKPFTSIPYGWKTICVLEFRNNVDIIDTIPIREFWTLKDFNSTIEIGFDDSL
jgi:hypothetical protein